MNDLLMPIVEGEQLLLEMDSKVYCFRCSIRDGKPYVKLFGYYTNVIYFEGNLEQLATTIISGLTK